MTAMCYGLKEIDVDVKETDFFITHSHPDHLDLALSIASNSSKIYFNQPDAESIGRSDEWNDEIYDIARVPIIFSWGPNIM